VRWTFRLTLMRRVDKVTFDYKRLDSRQGLEKNIGRQNAQRPTKGLHNCLARCPHKVRVSLFTFATGTRYNWSVLAFRFASLPSPPIPATVQTPTLCTRLPEKIPLRIDRHTIELNLFLNDISAWCTTNIKILVLFSTADLKTDFK
jgi:hypothetical protein